MGHFCLSPDDSIPVAALGLLAGLRGKRAARAVIFQLPLAWFGGGTLALLAHVGASPPLQCASFLAAGVLIAAAPPLPGQVVAAVAVAIGLLHGFLNGAAMRGASAGSGALALTGMAVTIFVLVTGAAALVVSIRVSWGRIVVRVAGSWIAAIGLLMLGWALRPGH